MTIENVKKQSSDIIKMKNIVEQYREQVELLKKEIAELEEEVSETLDFKKDVELQEKKERLPNFEKRLKQAEQKNSEVLRTKGMHLMTATTRYQQKEMAADEQIDKAYQTAVNDLRKAFESVEAYELERENKAEQLANEVADAGYTDAMNGLGLASVNDQSFKVLDVAPTKINLKAHNQDVQTFFKEVLNK